MTKDIRKVCIYCASSPEVDQKYFDAAASLAKALAQDEISIQYGGGAIGLMGKVADIAMDNGGKVIGIIPQFMREIELGHNGITDLIIVPDMHTRKARMVEDVDAVIALPGGVGTLEELLEILTWKRLGIMTKPIIIVNIDGYYDPLIEMMEKAISQRFMKEGHRKLWYEINDPENIVARIREAPEWNEAAVKYTYKP